MSLRVGDSLFRRDGTPTIVREQDKASGKLTLKSDPEEIKTDLRHGYVNGLSPKTRQEFNEIMDEVKEIEDPEQRALELSSRLEELEKDPRNHVLSQYVRAEMLHLMNTHRIKPKEYTADALRART